MLTEFILGVRWLAGKDRDVTDDSYPGRGEQVEEVQGYKQPYGYFVYNQYFLCISGQFFCMRGKFH